MPRVPAHMVFRFSELWNAPEIRTMRATIDRRRARGNDGRNPEEIRRRRAEVQQARVPR